MSWQPFTSQVLSSLCSWLTSIVKAIKTLTKFLFMNQPLTGHFKLLWSWWRSRLLELNLANHCLASFKQNLPSSRVNNLDALLRNCLWWLITSRQTEKRITSFHIYSQQMSLSNPKTCTIWLSREYIDFIILRWRILLRILTIDL